MEEIIPRRRNSGAREALEVVRGHLTTNIQEQIAALVNAAPSLEGSSHLVVMQLQESLDRMRIVVDDALEPSAAAYDASQREAGSLGPERAQVDKVLRALASTTSSRDTDSFLQFCVKILAELFDCRYALVAVVDHDRWHARTLAVWAEGKLADNFEYDLRGTPCEDVLRLNKELISCDASTLYADDEMLVEMGIESYFGAPIVSEDHCMVGFVSVMDTKPMELDEWVAPILGVFASRIAVELQRKSAFEDLESRVAERTQALRSEINDRKQIEARLEERNTELQQFLYAVSHDLKSPLVTILGFLGLMEKDIEAGEFHRLGDNLQPIGSAAKQMARMLNELLELSKIGEARLERTPISVAEAAGEAVERLAGLISERGAEIIVEPDLPPISAVRSQLVHVMQNLIGNATTYVENGTTPRVEVGCRPSESGSEVIHTVRDNGIGIDPQYHEKIFGLFERMDREREGTGLGLAIVKRIIEVHGGRVWVESEEGKGATFCFAMPAG